ncbi:MAG: 4-amino-4-deoxy-L-arabinose transferase and related glycosyltransferase of family-like protein [Myxococcales bacterium]|nr:4-amino-4-deoxy-L-arabinose transferase and related glycosyltransferase of family-like protein [Myxococcales bacterium]
MSSELAQATVPPRRRRLGLELALVVLVSLGVLVPGIWNYSLVDPWETHYGEVGRMMLQEHDWVHMQWPGGMSPDDNEGFRSKPVLTFWLMAAGMRSVGLAADGGYSGEMTHDARTMVGIRLPFVLFGVLGLTLMWWMLARLVNRRLAWLALLVVLTCPFYCLIARQGIPDMPLCACVMGAIAMFVMAMEDGARSIDEAFTVRLPGNRRLAFDQRQLLLLICGGFVLIQAAYYAVYFTASPRLALVRFPNPAIVLPLLMAVMFCALSPDGWLVLRLPFLMLGGLTLFWIWVYAKITGSGAPRPRSPRDGRTSWRVVFDYLGEWDRYALDRRLVRLLLSPVAWSRGEKWEVTDAWADRVLGMARLTSMRQIYLLWCYALLGVSVLAKGPPGLGVVGIVGAFYVVMSGGWRRLWEGHFELKRGILMMLVMFLPWHLAEWLKEGARFIDEYLFTHILNRAAVGVDNSPGTFEYYTSQIGHGMWLWAGLLPAAFAAALLRARTDTREGRVRFLMVLWAISAVAFFSLVQTKFHHYILPAVPALGVLVAFFLDDLWERRERFHPLYAGIAIAIVLFICRDLVWEPERWIEMFVFRYDRPWPVGDPWQIDPSDGFIFLGVIAVAAIAIAALPWRRFGVVALCTAGLSICLWSLHGYMPVAGTHWGMREAARAYYAERTIYGEKRVYFGAAELYDDLGDLDHKWRFRTFVPDTLQMGQPMTIQVQVNKAEDERIMEQAITMIGTVTHIGDHEVEVTLPTAERAKLDPLIVKGKTSNKRGRPMVHAVDADRLIAWQLYWRGENFWSGDELFAWLPEMKTGFNKTDNVDFTKYLNDRTKAPLGRRYFVITEAGRATTVRSMLPTPRARDSFEIIDTTSNKFSIVAFYL